MSIAYAATVLFSYSCSDVKFQPIGAVLLSGMIKLTTEAKEVGV